MAEPTREEGRGLFPARRGDHATTVPFVLAAPLLGNSRLLGPGNTSRSIRRAAERYARRERGKGTTRFGSP